jgi:hypothetical protein
MEPSSKKLVQTSQKSDVIRNEKFSVNKVQIMNYHLLLSVVGLVPPKNATPFVRLLYKVFITVILITFMFALLGQLMAVYVHWGDIPVLSITISHMSGLILAIISCAHFLHSKDKFLNLIDLLRMEFVPRIKAKYIEFVRIAESQVKKFLIISLSLAMLCGFIWIGIPIIRISNFGNNNATTDGHDFERLIFVIWAPFEINDSPQFELIMVFEMFASGFSALTLFAVDIIFLSLMSHAAAQFKVLCAMLNDMHENISENELHRTERASAMHVSTDSSMKETMTSRNDIVPHDGNSGSRKYETARSEIGRVGEDPILLYLAECIKYHQAVIG